MTVGVWEPIKLKLLGIRRRRAIMRKANAYQQAKTVQTVHTFSKHTKSKCKFFEANFSWTTEEVSNKNCMLTYIVVASKIYSKQSTQRTFCSALGMHIKCTFSKPKTKKTNVFSPVWNEIRNVPLLT